MFELFGRRKIQRPVARTCKKE